MVSKGLMHDFRRFETSGPSVEPKMWRQVEIWPKTAQILWSAIASRRIELWSSSLHHSIRLNELYHLITRNCAQVYETCGGGEKSEILVWTEIGKSVFSHLRFHFAVRHIAHRFLHKISPRNHSSPIGGVLQASWIFLAKDDFIKISWNQLEGKTYTIFEIRGCQKVSNSK